MSQGVSRVLLCVLVLSAALAISQAQLPAEQQTEYTGKHPWRRMRRNVARLEASEADQPIVSGLVEPVTAELEAGPQQAVAIPVAATDGVTSAAAVPTETAAAAEPDVQMTSGGLLVPDDTSAAAAAAAAAAAEPTRALPAGVVAATPVIPGSCAYQYAQTDIRPIRVMWNSSAGYCAESSLQMILLARGVWIGQAKVRELAKCQTNDLILDSRDVTVCSAFRLLGESLAFDMPSSSYWDYFNQTLRYASGGSKTVWPYGRSNTVGYPTPPATDFVQWVKRQITAGRPLMVAVRLPKTVLNDAVYDHIIPFWGVCSGDVGATAALNSATDGFSLSTDFGDEIFRTVSTPGFYSRWQECTNGLVWGGGGCIPTDTWNYGLAIGYLKDNGNIFVKTTKLVITRWSDGTTAANSEPGEGYNTVAGSTVMSRYNLTVWNLKSGATYTTYRFPGRLPPLNPALSSSKWYTATNPAVLPGTVAALKDTCTKTAGCTSTTYTAPASGTVTITETALGAFAGNSLHYFLTVLG